MGWDRTSGDAGGHEGSDLHGKGWRGLCPKQGWAGTGQGHSRRLGLQQGTGLDGKNWEIFVLCL